MCGGKSGGDIVDSEMSLLDFPSEVTAIMMKKLRLVGVLKPNNKRSEFV